MKNASFLLITALLIIIACDRPDCTNTNAVFDANLPESNEYKTELMLQLWRNHESLTYWFDRYEEKDGKKLMTVFVQGDNLCAKAVITIREPNDKLDGIIRAKGGGYHGAKLDGLEFATVKQAGETVFVYKNLGSILD